MENPNVPREANPSRRSEPRLDSADFADDEAVQETRGTESIENESELNLGGDVGFDRIVGADEAGLGDGLDQAEEALLGVTDEELARGKPIPGK